MAKRVLTTNDVEEITYRLALADARVDECLKIIRGKSRAPWVDLLLALRRKALAVAIKAEAWCEDSNAGMAARARGWKRGEEDSLIRQSHEATEEVARG